MPDDDHVPKHIADDDDIDDAYDDDDESDERPLREGLPPTYRMRHEAHYVETLVTPAVAGQPPSMAAPSSPLPVAAAPAVTPPHSLAVVAQSLAESLEAIRAALGGLSTGGRTLGDRLAIDVARAESMRAQWLTDAAVALHCDPLPALDEVDLSQVLRAVGDALALERRLTGSGPTVAMSVGASPVFGDERLLTSALGGVLSAMRMLVDDRGDQAKVSAALGERVDGANRTLVVTQAAVRVSDSALTRFFDAEWRDHPAGRSGALLLAAARRVVTAHGGSLDLTAIDAGGFRLSFSLPAAG